jgi:hypothetical protein
MWICWAIHQRLYLQKGSVLYTEQCISIKPPKKKPPSTILRLIILVKILYACNLFCGYDGLEPVQNRLTDDTYQKFLLAIFQSNF